MNLVENDKGMKISRDWAVPNSASATKLWLNSISFCSQCCGDKVWLVIVCKWQSGWENQINLNKKISKSKTPTTCNK